MEAELKALKQCEVIIARLNFSIVHYMFAVFEKQRKKIYIYDLLHSTQSRSTYFKREIAYLYLTYKLANGWRAGRTFRSLLQTKATDCGVWTILNAFFYVNGTHNPPILLKKCYRMFFWAYNIRVQFTQLHRGSGNLATANRKCFNFIGYSYSV